MFSLSATCVAIALADQAGTLQFEACEGRFGAYVAISDDVGVIEIADDLASAIERVRQVRARVEAGEAV